MVEGPPRGESRCREQAWRVLTIDLECNRGRLEAGVPRKDLTHPPPEGLIDPFPNHTTMGQQLNKIIKRKRRAAYLKRRKAKALAAKKK
jgi:hypothetical protein